MTRTLTALVPPPAVRRAARRQWAIRAVSGLVIAAALAYTSIPIWLPTGLLAARLAEQLSLDLNRTVHIGRIRVGWTEGVVVEDVIVQDRAGAGNPFLVRIGQVRCDLAPISMLLDEKVGQLNVISPEVWLVIDETGRSNFDGFGEERGGRLPSLHYMIRDLVCHVVTPAVAQVFRVDRLSLHLEPASGRLELAGVTKVDRVAPDTGEPQIGRLSVDANLKLPRLKRSEKLSGEVRVEWGDLALTDLPVPLISRVPVEQVDGTTTGGIHFRTHPDLKIDYELDIAFDGVQIMRPELQRPAQVPDAEVRCGGHWDPTAEVVRLDHLRYTTPAIEVHGARGPELPALRVEQSGEVPFELHLAGRIRDWEALRREFPEVDAYARAMGVEFTGGADFAADVIQAATEERFLLTVDARDSYGKLARGGRVYLATPPDTPKRLMVELTHDRVSRRLLFPRVEVTLGGITMSAGGQAPQPRTDDGEAGPVEALLEILPGLKASLSIRCDNMREVRRQWPGLESLLAEAHWSGPAEILGEIRPGDDRARLDLVARLPADAELRIRDLLEKSAGDPLVVTANLGLPFTLDGRLDDLSIELSYRDARLILDGDGAGLQYRTSFAEGPDAHPVLDSLDASWDIPLHVEHLEQFVGLSPRWQAWQAEGLVPTLAGSMRMSLLNHISYRPDDWLLRGRIRIAGHDLSIKWKDWIDKDGGTPLEITFTHRSQLTGGQTEHALSATMAQPGGAVSASILLAGMGSDRPDDDFEELSVRAEIEDLARWLKVSPALTAVAKPFGPSGQVSMQLENLHVGRWQSGWLSLDATDASVLGAGHGGIDKQSGVAAGAKLHWQAHPSPDDADLHVWELTDGTLRLAGLEVADLSGTVKTSSQISRRGRLLHSDAALQLARTTAIHAADLRARGELTFSNLLASLHPRLREWLDALHLVGSAEWDTHLRADPRSLVVDAGVDLGSAGMAIETGEPLVPTVTKPVGIPVSAAVTLSVDDWLDRERVQVHLHNASLSLHENDLAAHGTAELRRAELGRLMATQLEVGADVDLRRPGELLDLLPKTPIETLDGALSATIRINGADGLTVEGGTIRFVGFEAGLRDRPLRLDGTAAMDSTHLNLEQVHWDWGRSNGVVSGLLALNPAAATGRIGVACERLHVEDLRACANQLIARFTVAPASSELDKAAEEARTRAMIVEKLRSADLMVDAHVGTMDVKLPLDIRAVCDALSQRVTVREGQVAMTFGTLVDGGRVEGQLHAGLNAADPAYHLTYTAERIQPGPVVDAYLRRTFPGMVATGPLTLIDETIQKILPAPGEPNYEIGRGELIIENGTVSGRAAPLWMARIFPGLNLASYDFTYMHSWFDKTADGRVHHQMIYQGTFYNIYMIGYSEPDGTFRYEVGLDFLARFDSQYWADVGQGRVPLFTKSGRVLPDGTIDNEVVTFVSIRRVLETLLVQNNPVITAYHAVRKQVLGKK